ncbi:MAG: preprotein translocase subunit YajC [bacterium]
MNFFMVTASFLPALAGGGEAGDGGFLSLVVMMAIIFGIFYFLVIRPQKNEQQRHQAMISNIKKGDRVVTAGGIHGQVSSVSDDTIKIKIAKDIKLKVNRTSIMQVKGKQDNEEEGDET